MGYSPWGHQEWENRVGLFKPKDRNYLHPKSPSDAGWQYPGLRWKGSAEDGGPCLGSRSPDAHQVVTGVSS